MDLINRSDTKFPVKQVFPPWKLIDVVDVIENEVRWENQKT